MNHASALAALFVFLCTLCAAQSPRPPQETAPPRLVVVIVVDQLAEWTYREARPFFGPDGFLRLEREGVRFTECRFRHAVTQTGPGHATIGTGADPAVHGITGNNWHALDGTKLYCCTDKTAKRAAGATSGDETGPAQLAAPTVAERMRAHFGEACQTACVAWKDRSAILLGGRTHWALWVDAAGNFVTSTAYGTELPLWVRALNTPLPAAGKYSGRVWERCAREQAYAGLVDDRPFEVLFGGTRTLPRPVGKPGAAPDISAVGSSPFAMDTVLDGAVAACDALTLGADAVPDFLGVAFSPVDAVGHNFDPTSVEVRDMILATDLRVARLLALLEERVGLDRCVVVLTADHGITPAPEVLNARGELGARASFTTEAAKLVNRTLLDAYGEPKAPHKRYAITGTTAGVLLDAAAIAAAGRTIENAAELGAAALEVMARGTSAAPGPLAAAVAVHQLEKRIASEPDPARRGLLQAMQRSTFAGRSGQIAFALREGFIESGSVASHGSPHPRDQAVPLMVRAPGLARGKLIADPVSPRLVATILQQLLALPAGPVVPEALPAALR